MAIRKINIGHPLDRLLKASPNGITQEQLNIEDKQRVNLFPWKGQFSPQLIEVILKEYSNKGETILDPFMGSGTVIYEAGRLGLRAIGSEINPAAFSLANTYTLINIATDKRSKLIKVIESKINELVENTLPLFGGKKISNEVCAFERVVEIYKNTQDTTQRLVLETVITLLDRKDTAVSINKISTNWHKLKERILGFPYSNVPLTCFNCDARDLPLEDNSIGLVVTSPPYINVFNYHQQYRSSMEGIGWNLLEVARSEIGSNRKHRSNRFLTITQYILDMADVFCELNRVVKRSGKVIFVVGRESNVKKTQFFNSVIINDLVSKVCGFNLKQRQERVFVNRFGSKIYEDILYYELTGSPLFGFEREKQLHEIALLTLREAQTRAPRESLADLTDAIEKVSVVNKSPLYSTNHI